AARGGAARGGRRDVQVLLARACRLRAPARRGARAAPERAGLLAREAVLRRQLPVREAPPARARRSHDPPAHILLPVRGAAADQPLPARSAGGRFAAPLRGRGQPDLCRDPARLTPSY